VYPRLASNFILLPWHTRCWDYRPVPPHWAAIISLCLKCLDGILVGTALNLCITLQKNGIFTMLSLIIHAFISCLSSWFLSSAFYSFHHSNPLQHVFMFCCLSTWSVVHSFGGRSPAPASWVVGITAIQAFTTMTDFIPCFPEVAKTTFRVFGFMLTCGSQLFLCFYLKVKCKLLDFVWLISCDVKESACSRILMGGGFFGIFVCREAFICI
jgi:hypothetical protein